MTKKELEKTFCLWELWEEESGIYGTSCDNAHYFECGALDDNKYLFCPYCGKKIKEIIDED